jgi:hypothetical protein
MKSILLAAVALALLPQAAFAAGPQIDGIVNDLLSADWPESSEVKDTLFGPITVDTGTFPLARTKLTDVAAALGGSVRSTEDFGATVRWLCYESGDTRTSFIAATTDKSGDAIVNMIAEETISPASPDAGCTRTVSVLVPLPGDDIPGFGATLVDLTKRFGTTTPDAQGKVSFFNQATVDSELHIQNIYYVVKDGAVVSVCYSQLDGGA